MELQRRSFVVVTWYSHFQGSRERKCSKIWSWRSSLNSSALQSYEEKGSIYGTTTTMKRTTTTAKNNWFYEQNNISARASRLLVHFFDVHCTNTKRNLLMRRFIKHVNIRRQIFLCHFGPGQNLENSPPRKIAGSCLRKPLDSPAKLTHDWYSTDSWPIYHRQLTDISPTYDR